MGRPNLYHVLKSAARSCIITISFFLSGSYTKQVRITMFTLAIAVLMLSGTRDVMLILTCFKEHDIKLVCVACTNVYLVVYVPCPPVPLQRKMPIQCEEYLWSK